MMDERFREMISLIARGLQQWCDCLRDSTAFPRGMPAPFRVFLLFSFSASPRSAPAQPRDSVPHVPLGASSVRAVHRCIARTRVSTIMVAYVCGKVGAKLLNRRLRNQITDRDTGRDAHALFMDHTACLVSWRYLFVREEEKGGRGTKGTEGETRAKSSGEGCDSIYMVYRC